MRQCLILVAAMIVAESATSFNGMVILQNSSLLTVIRLHKVSWPGFQLVSKAKLKIGSS